MTNGLPTPSGSEYGVVYLDQRDVIEKQITDMRPNCDVLVVSCHWVLKAAIQLRMHSAKQPNGWLTRVQT